MARFPFRLLLLLAASPAFASEVLIDGDRITLYAQNESLRGILAQFAQAGVSVQIDPSVDKQITGAVVDEDMETALNSLLPPYGYAAIWTVLRGPLGDVTRLAELQVFPRDKPRNLQPLVKDDGNLKVTRGPGGGPEFVQDEILLAAKAGTSLAEFRHLLAQVGGTVIGSSPEIGIYRVRFPPGSNIPALVEQLKQNPIIDSAEPNYVARISAPTAVGKGAAKAADLSYPAGAARVAVLDSGLVPAAAPDSGVVASYDALLPDRGISDPDGHGTQMALLASGAIAPEGSEANDQGIPIVAIRAFDDNGATSNFAVMRAIEYAIAQGSRVINLSWGTETSSEFIADAVRYAQSKGAIVVAAAGNEPTGKAVYPASYTGVVKTAALNPDGSVWENSNYGNGVTVAAPGVADMPVGHDGNPGLYAGTSIASAVTANTLAQYLTLHPQATASEAVKALQAAVNTTGKVDPRVGYGKLDAAALARFLK